ncbi:zinc-dependent alcohol dehydrogenase family protein [Mycobacterium sp.]|uniref:zinc-dependent alcohol dehydrogenase family protein n=1 Tax=Mycobacterium sp. TaxID=1785 RepID=UPI003D0C5F1B
MSETTAIRLHDTGGPEVLTYEQIPMPEPGPGEIRLTVEAIGVGYGECLYRMGRYVQETRLPSSLGNNAVGTVDAIGPGVDEPTVGERISLIPSFQMNRYGVYAQHAIVPATAWAPYFPALSLEDNASIWMQVTTAYGALVHHGQVAAGDFVLITPASGGVGMAAIQTAKQAGATTIGTTRRRAKAEALVAAGADHVIVTDDESLTERVNEITNGRGVRLVFNALTGDIINDLARAVSPGGTIFMYGAIGGQPTELPLALINKGVRVQGYTLYELTYHEQNLPGIRRYVADGVRGGYYTPNVGKVFHFGDMADAHRYLEAGNMTGSVVVLVKPERQA